MCGNPRSLPYRVIRALPPPRRGPRPLRLQSGRAVSSRTELGRHIFIITNITRWEGDLSLPKQCSHHRKSIIHSTTEHGYPLTWPMGVANSQKIVI